MDGERGGGGGYFGGDRERGERGERSNRGRGGSRAPFRGDRGGEGGGGIGGGGGGGGGGAGGGGGGGGVFRGKREFERRSGSDRRLGRKGGERERERGGGGGGGGREGERERGSIEKARSVVGSRLRCHCTTSPTRKQLLVSVSGARWLGGKRERSGVALLIDATLSEWAES